LVSKEVWATFPRQNEAMNFAKEHADVRIFSYQDHHNGQRRFLVSTYREFWRRFSLLSFLFAMMFRINTNISGTFSDRCLVFCPIVFNFRYKNMDAKFRHHYEVIQEVRIFPLFSS
jgi:hypothetical protein